MHHLISRTLFNQPCTKHSADDVTQSHSLPGSNLTSSTNLFDRSLLAPTRPPGLPFSGYNWTESAQRFFVFTYCYFFLFLGRAVD